VKAVLESNIPGIAVTGEPTPNTSGAFEVVNVATGKVYHSKLQGGGYLDTDQAKLMAVLNEIKADLAGAAPAPAPAAK
jgi:selT/selW/selH-like putative selenoprotein